MQAEFNLLLFDLIIDRENEIKAFIPEEYWTIEGEFLKGKEKFRSCIFWIERKKVELSSRRRCKGRIKANERQ